MNHINNTIDFAYLDVLYVHGKDAEVFLQGQLTCNVLNLTEHAIQPTSCCNINGRILALFFITRWKEGYLLIFSPVMLKIMLKHFKKYAVFSKITFEYPVLADDKPMICLGFLSNPAHLAHCRPCVGLDKLCMDIFSADAVPIDALDATTWHHELLKQGFPIITSETQALFLPHRIGLQHFQGILDFNKGCYLGQEIIARTHFKATLKHSVCLCEVVEGDEISFLSGNALFDRTGEHNIGDIIDVLAPWLLITVLTEKIAELPENIAIISQW